MHNRPYLNENTGLYLGDATKNNHQAIFGSSDTGKSALVAIEASQMPNAIVLDPVSGAFRKPLGWLGETANWKFHEIGDYAKPEERLWLNVRDFGVRSVEAVFNRPKIPQSQLRVRQELFDFFARPPTSKRKTFQNFKQIFFEFPNAKPLFDELAKVLHPGDKGMDMEQLEKGRRVIDVSAAGQSSPLIGFLVGGIVDSRERKLKIGRKFETLMICLDEFDTYGLPSTAGGKAMAEVFKLGRKMGLIGVAIGTVQGGIDKGIKTNINIYFYFRSDDLNEKKTVWSKHHIDLSREYFAHIEDELIPKYGHEAARKGNCFLLAEQHGYPEAKLIHLDNYFIKLRESQNKKPSTYKVQSFTEAPDYKRWLSQFW
jgi:hypothetical protein